MASASPDERPDVPGITLQAWLATDIGLVREHNEDSACSVPDLGFFIVADGMGGHAAGEIASAMAVETVRKALEEQSATDEINAFKATPSDGGRRGLVTLLQNAVLSAHQAVYQRGQAEPDKAGMGTTLDVVLIAGPEAFVAHVGDSRTYLIRDGRTSQITTDHTVAEVLVIEGKLTIEEAQVSPLRTILVNAIGVSADVGVEMAHVTLKRDDRILLCSDGLHDYFPTDDEIASKLSQPAPGEALKDMVELAKTRGGHDNITGVAVHILQLVDAAVPDRIEPDSTQPVELPITNPFATDEPTETAFPPPVDVMQNALRSTQPMRAVVANVSEDQLEALQRHVAARADTMPPGLRPPAKPKAEKAEKTEKTDDGDITSESMPAKAAAADARRAATADPVEPTADTGPVSTQPTQPTTTPDKP